MFLDTQNPVNRNHPLSRGLVTWYFASDPWAGGPKWWDMFASNHAQLRGMGNTNNGWRSTTRPGGLGSVLFDGTAGFVDIPNSRVINGIANSIVTISVWVQFTSLPTSSPIVFSSWDGARGYQIFINKISATTGNLAVWSDVGGQLTGSIILSKNIWYHLASVWNGVNNYLYINGNLDVSAARTFHSTTFDSQIGCQAGGAGGTVTSLFFAGLMDDVRLYNRALSALDISDLYHNSKLGNPYLLNQRNSYLSLIKPSVLFRKTLSGLGTRTGKRQPQHIVRGL